MRSVKNIPFSISALRQFASSSIAKVKKSFAGHYAGIMWGSGVTFSISLIIWGFAYFGYIDLGLPVRYDYEILNNEIKKELPERYSYTIDRIKFRDGISESLLVIARDNNWTSISDRNIGSDIILILDKTDKKYAISYKFQPIVQNEFSAPLFSHSLSKADINADGKDELVVGWSYLGANFSPPYITVFASDASKNVSIAAMPRIMQYKYRPDHPTATMHNKYDKNQRFNVHEAHSVHAKKGELVALARNDDACNACAEEQVFELHKFQLQTDTLQKNPWGSLQVIKSFDAVKLQLAKEKYDMSRYE